jgi:imidazolonepropionase-like amidohydrolase
MFSRRLFRLSLSLLIYVVTAFAAEDKPIAIVHGTLIDGLGGAPVENATIILRGKLIEYAGPAGGVTVPLAAQLIDATGKSVMPGLTDLHVHVQGGWDGTAIDLLGYQRYMNSLLYAGVTTILDTGNYQPWILQLRQEQAAGRLLGPRIYCVGAMLDGADLAWPDSSYALTSVSQVEEFIRRDKRANVDMIKAYVNLSDRMLGAITESAAKQDLRVVIDQWERNGSPDLVATGIAGFAHAPTRKMSDEAIRYIKERNLFVISTLIVRESSARTRFRDGGFLREPLIADTTPPWVLTELTDFITKPQTDAEKKETANARVEFEESKRNVKKLLDAGVLLAAGTDAPFPGGFQGEGIHHELELLVESGFTPLQAIRASTYKAALIMKAESEWGSLQPGRRANLLIVAGRPAERISDTHKVETVILDGKILDRSSLRFDPKRDPGFRAVPGLFNP